MGCKQVPMGREIPMGAKQGSETRPLLPRVWGSDRDEFVTWKLIDSQTALLEQTSLLG